MACTLNPVETWLFVRLYAVVLMLKSLVYVCWQFWMYANPVGYMLNNWLVMLCVDDELLCLCLLRGFNLVSKFNMARFSKYLPVDNNS